MKFTSILLLLLINNFASAFPSNSSCQVPPTGFPELVYDFSINLVLSPGTEVGGINIYGGQQTFLSTVGGTFCARWNGGAAGTVTPGGTATYSQLSNGTGPYKLNLEYLLETNDVPPAYIFVKQSGWEVEYVGRTNYFVETGDARYSALNTGVWIGVETSYIANITGTFSSVDAYKAV